MQVISKCSDQTRGALVCWHILVLPLIAKLPSCISSNIGKKLFNIWVPLWFNLFVLFAGSQNVAFCLVSVILLCTHTLNFSLRKCFLSFFLKAWHFCVSTFISFYFFVVAFWIFLKDFGLNNLNISQLNCFSRLASD